MNSLRVTAVSALIILFGAAGGPAYANDVTVAPSQGGGNGTWTDATDTLCARANSYDNLGIPVIRTVVTIHPKGSGSPSFQITDNTPGNGAASCSGNLSVPEDQLWHMEVTVYINNGGGTATRTADSDFYT
jgi:hypothetical protein